jgi:hypothetical protein
VNLELTGLGWRRSYRGRPEERSRDQRAADRAHGDSWRQSAIERGWWTRWRSTRLSTACVHCWRGSDFLTWVPHPARTVLHCQAARVPGDSLITLSKRLVSLVQHPPPPRYFIQVWFMHPLSNHPPFQLGPPFDFRWAFFSLLPFAFSRNLV